jgi:hypothetical protein
MEYRKAVNWDVWLVDTTVATKELPMAGPTADWRAVSMEPI